MFGIVLPGDWAAIATLAIVAVTFVLFVRERLPPEVIAIGAAAVMMLLGLLPYDEAVSALSNAAPWTIAFMFIIMGGLLRTGALDVLSRRGVQGVAVSEAETAAAQRWAAERLRLVVEPGGAVALAALLGGRVAPEPGMLVLLSGGNVDPAAYARALAA